MPKCWYDDVNGECNPSSCMVQECGVKQGYVSLEDNASMHQTTTPAPHPHSDDDEPCFMNPELPRDCLECHDVACPYH